MIHKLTDLSEGERLLIIHRNRGMITEIAKAFGVSQSTVTRTFNGDIKRPNPKLVAFIEKRLRKIVANEDAAA